MNKPSSNISLAWVYIYHLNDTLALPIAENKKYTKARVIVSIHAWSTELPIWIKYS